MTNAISAVDFVTIPVEDIERARAFYTDVLGLTPGALWRDEDPMGAEFQAGNLTVALMDVAKFGREFAPNGNTIAYHVEDVPARVAELREQGVEVVMDTFDSGVCLQAVLKDSEGNIFNLHHRYAPKG